MNPLQFMVMTQPSQQASISAFQSGNPNSVERARRERILAEMIAPQRQQAATDRLATLALRRELQRQQEAGALSQANDQRWTAALLGQQADALQADRDHERQMALDQMDFQNALIQQQRHDAKVAGLLGSNPEYARIAMQRELGLGQLDEAKAARLMGYKLDKSKLDQAGKSDAARIALQRELGLGELGVKGREIDSRKDLAAMKAASEKELAQLGLGYKEKELALSKDELDRQYSPLGVMLNAARNPMAANNPDFLGNLLNMQQSIEDWQAEKAAAAAPQAAGGAAPKNSTKPLRPQFMNRPITLDENSEMMSDGIRPTFTDPNLKLQQEKIWQQQNKAAQEAAKPSWYWDGMNVRNPDGWLRRGFDSMMDAPYKGGQWLNDWLSPTPAPAPNPAPSRYKPKPTGTAPAIEPKGANEPQGVADPNADREGQNNPMGYMPNSQDELLRRLLASIPSTAVSFGPTMPMGSLGSPFGPTVAALRG